MDDSTSNLATIIAALIGAIIGTVGSTFIQDWLSNRRELQRERTNLIKKYLIQLQFSVELLSSRFNDFDTRRGLMTDEYFVTTTLYSLGRVLAYHLILDMVSADNEMVPRKDIQAFDKELDKLNTVMHTSLFRYDRQILAESLIERDEEYYRVITFLEFRHHYLDVNQDIKKFLDPALKFIAALNNAAIDEITPHLKDIISHLKQYSEL